MLSQAGPGAGARGLDRLLSSLTATAETMMREPTYARTLLESFKTRPGAHPLGEAIRAGGQQVLVEVMGEMREAGEL